jgi:hypothetical protein
MTHIVAGIAVDEGHMHRVIAALEETSIAHESIGVTLSEDVRKNLIKTGDEGVVAGVYEGGLLGGIVGAAVSAAAIVAGGFSLVAVGPMVAVISVIGEGVIVGGIAGAFVHAGLTEPVAKQYEKAVQDDRILIWVDSATQAEAKYIRDIFTHHQMQNISVLRKPVP